MARQTVIGRLLSGALLATAMQVALPGSAPGVFAGNAAQSSTGVVPNWADLDVFTRVVPSTRESELGLGLQLSGSGGVVLVSFAGRLDTRSPNIPPKEIAVLAAPGLMASPNEIRRPSLMFVIDEGAKNSAVIDANASLSVDDPAPGAIINSAATRIKAAEFIKLADAKTISGNVFGSNVTVRPDQIKAIRALAERLHLPLPKPTPTATPAPAPAAPKPPEAKPAVVPEPD